MPSEGKPKLWYLTPHHSTCCEPISICEPFEIYFQKSTLFDRRVLRTDNSFSFSLHMVLCLSARYSSLWQTSFGEAPSAPTSTVEEPLKPNCLKQTQTIIKEFSWLFLAIFQKNYTLGFICKINSYLCTKARSRMWITT